MSNPHQQRKKESQYIENSHPKKGVEKTIVDVKILQFLNFNIAYYQLLIAHDLSRNFNIF